MSEWVDILDQPGHMVVDMEDYEEPVTTIGFAALAACEAVEQGTEQGFTLAACERHKTELQCFGALVVYALALRGYIIVSHDKGAAMIRAMADARDGRNIAEA